MGHEQKMSVEPSLRNNILEQEMVALKRVYVGFLVFFLSQFFDTQESSLCLLDAFSVNVRYLTKDALTQIL